MEIRDTRNGSWYWVNTAVNACPHITHADKSVYGALASFGGCTEIRPSFENISERSNTSIRQAKKSIKNLSTVEIISIITGGGRGKANVYQLNKCAKGCKLCTVSKGCKIVQERVQNLSINGAKNAPQVDKEIDKEKRVTDKSVSPDFKDLMGYYHNLVLGTLGFKPEIRAKDGKILKSMLAKHGADKVKKIIYWYLGRKDGDKYIADRLGVDLSICLSAYVINQYHNENK